eukprot:1371143-Amphidinium_carterae.2
MFLVVVVVADVGLLLMMCLPLLRGLSTSPPQCYNTLFHSTITLVSTLEYHIKTSIYSTTAYRTLRSTVPHLPFYTLHSAVQQLVKHI